MVPSASLEALGPWGSLGGPPGWVACRGETLDDLGGANRQSVLLDAYTIKGILIFAGLPELTLHWSGSRWWGYVREFWAPLST